MMSLTMTPRRRRETRTTAVTGGTDHRRPVVRSTPYLRSHSMRNNNTTASGTSRTATTSTQYNQNAAVLNSSCIDLTVDDDEEEEIVDLTSIGDQSPIILRSSQQTAVERAERIRGLSVLLEYDRADQVDPRLDSDTNRRQIEANKKKKKKIISSVRTSSEDDDEPCRSSTTKEVVCPICLDTLARMRKNNKGLKSTICGHIFCSDCIDQAFLSHKCCPTCRKKLTAKLIHPIFI